MSSQNRATLRRKAEVAMSHSRLANEILDSIKDSQDKLNATLDKLDADTAIALDTDYAASNPISDLFEADSNDRGAQHQATLRASLRSALKHRRLADEISDSIEEFQVAYNALLAKLDAEAGTLNDTDYASLLAVDAIDPDAAGFSAQHKASFRRVLRSSMANRRAADQIIDAIAGMQAALNSCLALLDAGTVNGAHAALKVTALTPDQE